MQNNAINCNSFATASQGIQNGIRVLERNAAKIASADQLAGNSDPTASMVESKANQINIAANAKVLATADDNLGTILDIMA